MSRKALRAVLLDLKSQMRGKRASAYLRKDDDVEPIKDPPKSRKEESGDSADDKLGADKAGDKPREKAKKLPDGPPDFEAEMKKFFNKKNTGKARVSQTLSAKSDFVTVAKKPEIVKPKGK